jgi:hypothetical protein
MRQRDEHMFDLLFDDNSLGVVKRSETFQSRQLSLIAVAQIAGDPKSELIAMGVDAFDDSARQLAIAGDENAIEIFSDAMPSLDDRAHHRAAEDDEEHRTDEEDAECGA